MVASEESIPNTNNRYSIKNYNEEIFCDGTVVLQKEYDQIIKKYVASEYDISKSICSFRNVLLRSRKINLSDSGIKHEVCIIVFTCMQDIPHMYSHFQ